MFAQSLKDDILKGVIFADSMDMNILIKIVR